MAANAMSPGITHRTGGATTVARRRASDYDINNMVMPVSVGAKYVEHIRHEHISTPHWRLLPTNRNQVGGAGLAADGKQVTGPGQGGEAANANEELSSDEDTDDETYERRHAHLEAKEKERYLPAPSRKLLDPDSTPGGSGGNSIASLRGRPGKGKSAPVRGDSSGQAKTDSVGRNGEQVPSPLSVGNLLPLQHSLQAGDSRQVSPGEHPLLQIPTSPLPLFSGVPQGKRRRRGEGLGTPTSPSPRTFDTSQTSAIKIPFAASPSPLSSPLKLPGSFPSIVPSSPLAVTSASTAASTVSSTLATTVTATDVTVNLGLQGSPVLSCPPLAQPHLPLPLHHTSQVSIGEGFRRETTPPGPSPLNPSVSLPPVLPASQSYALNTSFNAPRAPSLLPPPQPANSVPILSAAAPTPSSGVPPPASVTAAPQSDPVLNSVATLPPLTKPESHLSPDVVLSSDAVFSPETKRSAVGPQLTSLSPSPIPLTPLLALPSSSPSFVPSAVPTREMEPTARSLFAPNTVPAATPPSSVGGRSPRGLPVSQSSQPPIADLLPPPLTNPGVQSAVTPVLTVRRESVTEVAGLSAAVSIRATEGGSSIGLQAPPDVGIKPGGGIISKAEGAGVAIGIGLNEAPRSTESKAPVGQDLAIEAAADVLSVIVSATESRATGTS
eukprot:TRINITY_DN984_c0_g2_i1.p1 TRINITY_DN984_c0_g2~~TRINITY_DN984_c0_g2_i1.p1  ORF type:complete len:737 (-),score=113.64 TRINITY_DN984_c0_g2_i1:1117-3114(-)